MLNLSGVHLILWKSIFMLHLMAHLNGNVYNYMKMF